MVQQIEGLKTKIHHPGIVQREGACQRAIHLQEFGPPIGKPSGAPECAQRIGSEGCEVDVLRVSRLSAQDLRMGIQRTRIGQVGTVVVDIDQRVIHASDDGEWIAVRHMHQGRNLPVVYERSRYAVQGVEVACCHHGAIEDVPEVESAIRFVAIDVCRILDSYGADIRRVVRDVDAVRPGVVREQHEIRRYAVLNGGHHTVVTGIRPRQDVFRSGAAPRIHGALGRIGKREGKARCVVTGCRAVCGTCPMYWRRAAVRAGDVSRGIHRQSIGAKGRVISHVVDLRLPTMAELPLHARGPLNHVGRVELGRERKVLCPLLKPY